MMRNPAIFIRDSVKQELKWVLESLKLIPNARSILAARYLHGSGLEIGALHNPLRLPRYASVRYVDRMTKEELYKHYPELANKRLVKVDIVDDAEKLLTIPDSSQDFLIANHFLEHTENTFLTIRNLLRVIRPGGCLFMAIPDMRFTFDRDRDPTFLKHLIRDYEEGPSWSREAHYDEWVGIVNKLEGEQARSEKRRLMEMNYSIHFHAWTSADILDFLSYFNRLHARAYQVECMERAGEEVISILRKV
jgi:predicted SAM-dependent methyltransferase